MDTEAAEDDTAEHDSEEAPRRRLPIIPDKPKDDAVIEDHRKFHWPYRN